MDAIAFAPGGDHLPLRQWRSSLLGVMKPSTPQSFRLAIYYKTVFYPQISRCSSRFRRDNQSLTITLSVGKCALSTEIKSRFYSKPYDYPQVAVVTDRFASEDRELRINDSSWGGTMGFLTLVRTGPTGTSASQGPDLLLGPTSGQVKTVIFSLRQYSRNRL